MAAGGKQERKEIRHLLDDFVNVQKRDTWDITGGHLNESKLWDPKTATRIPWESSKKPYLRLKEPSKLINHGASLPPLQMKNMTDTVMDFMLGPIGGMKLADKAKDNTASATPEPSFIDKIKMIPSDKQLIQELDLPELMLPMHQRKGKSTEFMSSCKYEFVTSHHALPTKLDQYNSMKDFENVYMKTDDTQQQRQAITGANETKNIERRLRKRLSELQQRHIFKGIPSFYTLKVYSDCWQELIDNSRIYRDVLCKIKDEYDRNVSMLLDAQDKQSDGLHDQLSLLSSRSETKTEELNKEATLVENLEKMAMKALEKNQSLKDELKEEKEKAEYRKFHADDRNQKPARNYAAEEKKKDLEEQVSELHQQIEKQLVLLDEIKKDRKENHVPVIVCQRLEQGIKETEVDIQKLLKQNEFLENNIENLEEELEDLLLECKAKQSDSRNLWKKINTSKLQNLMKDRMEK
eukprot:gene536-1187_t